MRGEPRTSAYWRINERFDVGVRYSMILRLSRTASVAGESPYLPSTGDRRENAANALPQWGFANRVEGTTRRGRFTILRFAERTTQTPSRRLGIVRPACVGEPCGEGSSLLQINQGVGQGKLHLCRTGVKYTAQWQEYSTPFFVFFHIVHRLTLGPRRAITATITPMSV